MQKDSSKTSLPLSVLLLLSAQFVLAQDKPRVPDLDRVRLAEAFRIGETLGNRIWKKRGQVRAPQRVRPAGVPISPSRPESFMRLSALMNLKGSQEEAKMVDRASLSGKEGGLAPDLWLRTTLLPTLRIKPV